MTLDAKKIETITRKFASGMSQSQVNDYVINSHVTTDRQIKQAILECENRFHNLDKLLLERKRAEVKYRKKQKELEESTDEFEKELIKLDLEDMDLDFDVWTKREIVVKKELNFFIQYIQDLGLTEEELHEKLEYNPEEERKYWIARMGKQAALDYVTTGRIGNGNLDSIAMMPEEDQIAIFKVAFQYSGLLNVSLNKIKGKIEPYLNQLEKSDGPLSLPTFHGIENNLEVPLLNKLKTSKGELNGSRSSSTPSLQLTYKPQTS